MGTPTTGNPSSIVELEATELLTTLASVRAGFSSSIHQSPGLSLNFRHCKGTVKMLAGGSRAPSISSALRH